MAKKYRLKLKGGRIVGPFQLQQVGELYEKGHLVGTVKVQNFPVGDWTAIADNEEIATYLTKLAMGEKSSEISGDSTVARISLANLKEKARREEKELQKLEKIKELEELEKQHKKELHKEFKFSKEEKSEIVDYDKLEEKYKVIEEAEAEERIRNEELERIEAEKRKVEEEKIDKTVVLKNPLKAPVESDDEIKTVVNQDALRLFKEQEELKARLIREEELKKEAEEKAALEDAPEDIDFNESTKVVDKHALVELKAETNSLEKQIAKEERENKIEKSGKPKKESAESEDDIEKKKKLSPILAIVIIAILYLTLFDDKPEEVKVFKPQYLSISGPRTYEVMQPAKAEKHFKLGLKNYRVGTYLGKLRASSHFLKSAEFKFTDNPALGFLILTYGELFNNVANQSKGAAILFNLIKITRSKIFKDLNVAIGTALFYRNNGKVYSALNLIENYLRVAKPSLKLLSLYLDLSIETGDLVKAKKVLDKLKTIPNQPLEAYLAMSKYYTLDEQYEKGKEVTLSALKKFPSSVALMLDLSRYLLRDEDFKNYASTLKKIEKLRYEGAPSFYAEYLENVGILSAFNKDVKTAAALFQKALKIHDTDSLRSKLASLEIGGGEIAEKLILESKAIDLIRTSKKLTRERKWREAFQVAIEAVDLENRFLPANLHLVNLQILRGFYESAINTLAFLKKEFPTHPGVNFLLVKALSESNKMKEAQSHVNIISNSPLRNHPLYSSTVGHFYALSGKRHLAIRMLSQSVGQNPLRDEDYFLMAKIYSRTRQYKESKSKLAEAMTLDPLNIDYKSLYAEILYELDGAEAAIGYLQTELDKNADNPRLMGDIATLFYRNGQLAQFKEVKNKVEKLRSSDPAFYEFLIRAAQIEEKNVDIVTNAKALIEINPGDVKTRLLLGSTLADLRRYGEALIALDGVTKRLSTYPQVYYLKAKVYLKMKKYKEAIAAGKKEIENNPKIYHGHYVLGETQRLIGEYTESTKNLEKAIQIQPRNVESLMSLGWIKLNQSRYDIARELYLRAKKKAPSNPMIRKQLAFIYQGIGQGSLAIEEFRTYLKLFPNAPDQAKIKNQIMTLSR